MLHLSVKQMWEAMINSPSRSAISDLYIPELSNPHCLVLFFYFSQVMLHFHWETGDAGAGKREGWGQGLAWSSHKSFSHKSYIRNIWTERSEAMESYSNLQTKCVWQIQDPVVYFPLKPLLLNKNIKSQYHPRQQILMELPVMNTPSLSRQKSNL